MVRHDQRRAVVRVHLAPQLPQSFPRAQQRLTGGSAEREDHLRSDELQLAVEIRNAGGDLIGQGLPVLGGPAFDDVGDVHRIAGNINSLENAVEQLACLAHEGPSGGIFRRAGTFADEHQARVGIAFARHRVGAVGTEPAAVLGPYPVRHRIERFEPAQLVTQEARRRGDDGEAGARDRWRAAQPLGDRRASR
jgi:hypothetical protein